MPKLKRPPVQYADTAALARAFMDELYREAYVKGKAVAVDTEFEPITDEIEVMSYSWGRGIRRVVSGRYVKKFFGDWLSDPHSRITYQNYKADAVVLNKIGIETLASFYSDIMITGVMRDETLLHHGLKSQGKHFLGWVRREYHQLFAYVPLGKKKPIVLTPKQVMRDEFFPPDALLQAVVGWKRVKQPNGKFKNEPVLGPRSRAEWIQLMLDYAGDDAEETIMLHHSHRRFLTEIGYWQVYKEIDHPFTVTLMECEDHGVKLDLPRLKVIRRKQLARKMRAEHVFRELSGNPKLNLNSDVQMRKLLIEEWGWPVREDLMTDGGVKNDPQPQMGKEALAWWSEEHGLELADVKAEYNNAKTQIGTFLTGLIEGCSDDGRLRSDLNQIGAKATGRISSRKSDKLVEEIRVLRDGSKKITIKKIKVGANLQNIPSRKEKDPFGIRGAFRAPRIGEYDWRGHVVDEEYVLIVADYSGFELCMAIHWSSSLVKHSPMLEIMNKYGSPSAVHSFTAINMFAGRVHKCEPGDPICWDKKTNDWKRDKKGVLIHKPSFKVRLGELTMDDWKLVKAFFPDPYTTSKNCNFNLLYGGSPSMLARLRGQDYRDDDVLAENQALADDWNELYQEIGVYQRHMIEHGYEHGWVPTISGRRGNVRARLEGRDSQTGRIIEDEWKRKGMISYGERCCMNIPCQGSAADIVKVAMNRIRNNKILRELIFGSLFPVHDEILMEGPKRNTAPALAQLIYEMKQPFKDRMKFEIDVEGASGPDWLSAKP